MGEGVAMKTGAEQDQCYSGQDPLLEKKFLLRVNEFCGGLFTNVHCQSGLLECILMCIFLRLLVVLVLYEGAGYTLVTWAAVAQIVAEWQLQRD